MLSLALEHLPDKLLHVAVRKNGLDKTSPWWQQMYFRLVWLPFMRFSCKVFKIPAPEKMNADGSFTFIEGIGIATDEIYAEAMCKDEFYRVKPLPVNTALPRESVQWGSDTWPKSDKPDRYHGIDVAVLKAVPAKALNDDLSVVEDAIKQADRIRHKLQTPV